MLMSLFLENEDTWWGEIREGIRITLKNNSILVYCVFTHPSLGSNEHLVSSTWYPLQGLQVHTASGAIVKKKRLLLKNCSELNNLSSVPTMRFNTGRIAIWSTVHTPFNLYVAGANDNRISTPQKPEQHHTHRNIHFVSKEQLHLRWLYNNPQLLQGTQLRQCQSITVSKWVHSFYDLSVHD